ncbi:protein-tyrosine phosphatase [Alicyclobacillus hesperidum]|uniref:Tyrosine-protein phosphatase n=1 Tax=Alicyclobacillus hesperidum TaxID=89784 RepID=A0A1H2RCR2_9BACL|nr:CpsB/CapC family capsule biosynthesis tyrosine phosphatase [Alicyclobacillus hesperidum]SDW16634.1 protein-tyrosine phosphatase [Alicyclobacillus hesperidum]
MTRPLTDIHAHILPGLDDGPADMEASRCLLAAMNDDGVHRAFCTPHYLSPHFEVAQEDIEDAFTHLEARPASDRPILAKGAEVRLSQRLEQDLQMGRVPTLGSTRYVLVEFETPAITDYALSLVYELLIRKYMPIMAHPERNLAIQRNPSLVTQLRKSGLLMQATAQAFILQDDKSRTSSRLAWSLLEQGQIDVIASDAHNTTTRPPGLQSAYERIGERMGESMVDTLMENADAIWFGEPCRPIEVAARHGRSGIFGWFRR